jgi:TatD DNase family protein
MFDSHCHLDFEALEPDLPVLLAEARAAGVGGWLVPGVGEHAHAGQDRVAAHADVYLATGTHPWWAIEVLDVEAELSALEERARRCRAVAIGECGLDLKRPGAAELEHQSALFEGQLRLARELDLPVVVHGVGAREQLLGALERVGLPSAGGVVHGFGGDLDWGRALIRRGLLLGIGCALTRPGRERLREAARVLPLEALLVETDAPDHHPERPASAEQHGGSSGETALEARPRRAERGTPRDLVEVVGALAELRGLSPEVVAAATAASARRLLGLAPP